MKNKSFLWIVLLFIISGLISWNLYFKKYLQKDSVDIASFPKEIDTWKSVDLPISELDYAILETRNVFVRRYTNTQGKEVYLFIVYSQNNRKVSHPPEVCYTGSGVSILEHSLDSIVVPDSNVVLSVNKLLLEKYKDKQVAFYWFKVGNAFTGSYWKQQILIAFKTLFGKPASSALLRVSVTVRRNDEAQAVKEAKEFTALITPDLFKYLP